MITKSNTLRRLAGAPTWIAAAFLLVALGGCGGVHREVSATPSETMPQAGIVVAVLPFENLTSHGSAGLIISELMSTELYRRGVFKLQEDTAVRKRLVDSQVDPAKLTNRTYAAEVAELLGADAVLVGAVTEYGYQHGLRENPSVGVNARLVTAGRGAVLWADSQSETGRGLFNRPSVSTTAEVVVAKLADRLSRTVR